MVTMKSTSFVPLKGGVSIAQGLTLSGCVPVQDLAQGDENRRHLVAAALASAIVDFDGLWYRASTAAQWPEGIFVIGGTVLHLKVYDFSG